MRARNVRLFKSATFRGATVLPEGSWNHAGFRALAIEMPAPGDHQQYLDEKRAQLGERGTQDFAQSLWGVRL